MAFKPLNKKQLVSEINVTPLVDVMLVLLIIFMISAPMLYNEIKLQLPQTSKVSKVQLQGTEVVLSISETGEFFVGDKKILREELSGEVREQMKGRGQQVLYLRAHYSLQYGVVARVISSLKNEGLSQIALVTEAE